MMWDPLDTLKTDFGFWNALVLALVLEITIFLVYILLYRRGNRKFQRRTLQTLPFMSGNYITDPEEVHLGPNHLYWGFMEVFKGYFDRLEEAHTGDLNDYLHWFVVALAVIFVIIVIGGA